MKNMLLCGVLIFHLVYFIGLFVYQRIIISYNKRVEKRRQEIIEEFKISSIQIRYRLDSGNLIYAENIIKGIFFIAGYKNNIVYLYDLPSGEERMFECKTFIEDIIDLSNDDLNNFGLRLYKDDVIDILIEEGYKLC